MHTHRERKNESERERERGEVRDKIASRFFETKIAFVPIRVSSLRRISPTVKNFTVEVDPVDVKPRRSNYDEPIIRDRRVIALRTITAIRRTTVYKRRIIV